MIHFIRDKVFLVPIHPRGDIALFHGFAKYLEEMDNASKGLGAGLNQFAVIYGSRVPI
jgi:hypothetical protein